MINVKDLEIEKEILPLFDYTNHPLAGEALLQLLTTVPGSVQAIIERQEIIKGFVADWKKLQQLSYSKPDLHEIYGFLTSHTHLENISSAELRINLIWKVSVQQS
jgi:DNA mismatch repair protein MutS